MDVRFLWRPKYAHACAACACVHVQPLTRCAGVAPKIVVFQDRRARYMAQSPHTEMTVGGQHNSQLPAVGGCETAGLCSLYYGAAEIRTCACRAQLLHSHYDLCLQYPSSNTSLLLCPPLCLFLTTWSCSCQPSVASCEGKSDNWHQQHR